MTEETVQVLRSNIGLSSAELESRVKGNSSVFKRQGIEASLQKEKVIIGGEEVIIRRLFIKTATSGDYANVGWVLDEDVSKCMICAQQFNMWVSRTHCFACGNLVCGSCRDNEAIVFELEDLPPQRVCNQCFWGQEPVYARHNKLADALIADATRRWTNGEDAGPSMEDEYLSGPSQLVASINMSAQSLLDDVPEKSSSSGGRSQQHQLLPTTTTHDTYYSDDTEGPRRLGIGSGIGDDDVSSRTVVPGATIIRKSTAEPVTHTPSFFASPSAATDTPSSSSHQQSSIAPSPPPNSQVQVSSSVERAGDGSGTQRISAPNKTIVANTAAAAVVHTPTLGSPNDPQPPQAHTRDDSRSDIGAHSASQSGAPHSPLRSAITPTHSSPVTASSSNIDRGTGSGNSSAGNGHMSTVNTAIVSAPTTSAAQTEGSTGRRVGGRQQLSEDSDDDVKSPGNTHVDATSTNTLKPALSPVTPVPFCCMKTKRASDGAKVFVNLLTVPAAYVEVGGVRTVQWPSTVLLNGKKECTDKGGDTCDTYDVCVDERVPDEMDTSVRDKIGAKVLTRVNEEYGDTLELTFKTPKIKNNYKGSDVRVYDPSGASRAAVSSSVAAHSSAAAIPTVNTTTSSAPSPAMTAARSYTDTSAATTTSTSMAKDEKLQKPAVLAPAIVKGWLNKEGQSFKSWKRRYFVLSVGELVYYEKPMNVPPFGEKQKGQLSLANAVVVDAVGMRSSSVSGDEAATGRASYAKPSVNGKQVIVMGAQGRDLKIEAEDEYMAEQWAIAIQEHIVYANQQTA